VLWHFDELLEFARSGHGGFIRDFRSGSIASIPALRIEVRSHSWTSHSCRYCCKSLFALVTKNSPGCRRDFRVKM
jgi:hypothetical protein